MFDDVCSSKQVSFPRCWARENCFKNIGKHLSKLEVTDDVLVINEIRESQKNYENLRKLSENQFGMGRNSLEWRGSPWKGWEWIGTLDSFWDALWLELWPVLCFLAGYHRASVEKLVEHVSQN